MAKYIPFETWVGALNFFVIQWSCFRLAQNLDADIYKATGEEVRIGWSWVGPVVPMTGWWGDYIRMAVK